MIKGLVPAATGLALLLCLSGCGLLRAHHAPATRTLALPTARPSVLFVITDPYSPTAMRTTSALIGATARPGERIVILSDRDGQTLVSAQAPAPPVVQVPDPPAGLPAQPTSFQRARYATAVRNYQTTVRLATSALRKRQQAQLKAWARATVERAAPASPRPSHAPDIDASLNAAAADLLSLRQLGIGAGTPVVLAIAGGTTAAVPPAPDGNLGAGAVVIQGFAASSPEELAWQASLVQAGAARVTLLTQATDGEFASVVGQDLDGAIPDTLTSVLFGLGEHTLSPAAGPQLRRLLLLLTVRYPHAVATINGYTDDLPAPGGNLRLSVLRAEAVRQWLISHGVAAGRLQAIGYGDTDPVAPNTPHGQPLNRRVVVIIDPAQPPA